MLNYFKKNNNYILKRKKKNQRYNSIEKTIIIPYMNNNYKFIKYIIVVDLEHN